MQVTGSWSVFPFLEQMVPGLNRGSRDAQSSGRERAARMRQMQKNESENRKLKCSGEWAA